MSEPNDEIQIDFGGPITIGKHQDKNVLTFFDRFSKYLTGKVLDKINGQVKNFCKQNNLNIITTPADDH